MPGQFEGEYPYFLIVIRNLTRYYTKEWLIHITHMS